MQNLIDIAGDETTIVEQNIPPAIVMVNECAVMFRLFREVKHGHTNVENPPRILTFCENTAS